jgi:hypothetical protein
MDEFDQIEADYMEQHPGQAPPSMQMQLYPLSMAQQQQYPLAQVPPPEPLLQRRMAGVPVWGWGLGAAAAAGLAYYLLNKNKAVAKNPEDESSSESAFPALPAGQRASRTGFCDRLNPFLQKNGIADKTVVYSDADEAAKKLKQVSPLVTIHCKVKPPIKELDKFAKREGLTAVEHEGGVVGFYPGGGKKGKAWEEYIDDLRDAGQKV